MTRKLTARFYRPLTISLPCRRKYPTVKCEIDLSGIEGRELSEIHFAGFPYTWKAQNYLYKNHRAPRNWEQLCQAVHPTPHTGVWVSHCSAELLLTYFLNQVLWLTMLERDCQQGVCLHADPEGDSWVTPSDIARGHRALAVARGQAFPRNVGFPWNGSTRNIVMAEKQPSGSSERPGSLVVYSYAFMVCVRELWGFIQI